MKLDVKKTLLLGLGFFGVSIINIINKSYIPIFLGNDFQLSPYWVGIIISIMAVITLIIQPIIGSISDKTRTRIGRRKPYILIFAPLSAITFSALPYFVVPGKLPFFLITLVLLTILLAMFRTPVIALMPDITPSKFRSQANGLINLMGGVGGIIATVAGSILYQKNPVFPFIASAGVLVLASLVVIAVIQEPEQINDETKKTDTSLLKNLKFVFNDKDKSALFLFFAIFFWFFGYFAIETFFTLYGTNVLGFEPAVAARQLVYLIITFIIFAVPSGMIAGKIGRRVTIRAGIISLSAILMIVYLLPVDIIKNGIALPILLALAGISWAFININSLPMVVDIAPKELAGSYTGLYYFFQMSSYVIVPIASGKIISSFGNNYGMIFIIAPVSLFIAFVLMFGVHKGEHTD